MAGVLTQLQRLKDGCLNALSARLTYWTKPLTSSLPLSTLADLGRSKSELVAENARLASTSDHPASTGETVCLYQD